MRPRVPSVRSIPERLLTRRMNRRTFIKSASSVAAASLPDSAAIAGSHQVKSSNSSRAKIAAYYFRAHMYTCVPRQIREDMEWMADKGTDFVCPAVVEQDLFAAQENLNLITEEAERVGMRVLAVPSRWAGLTAGAPKVPSLFSALNLHTLMQLKNGSTSVSEKVSGIISSIHAPETFEFFCDSLRLMYEQHPTWAGMIIDEPKAYRMDYSPMAIKALGKDAPIEAHYDAFSGFLSRFCAYAKQHWPDKLTILFEKADSKDKKLASASGVAPLDYFGADGRPWGNAEERELSAATQNNGGDHKVLLDGVGDKFISLARQQENRKAFLLIENHNMTVPMIDLMERHYAAVLRLPADMFCYYYYPRNVVQPERAMKIIGKHLKRFTAGK